MRKSILSKEWIKLRRIYPLICLAILLVTLYILLRIGRMVLFCGAEMVWRSILEQNIILVEKLRFLPLCVGVLLGLMQFIPEMTQNRIKLTLHLPYSRHGMILWMTGIGTTLFVIPFLVQLIVMWGVLRYIFAPELVTHILLTILPWYLVGIISYLQTVWIIIEPTWRGRLYNIMITGTVIYLSFMSSYPRSYDTMLPWMILLVLCSLFYPLYSTERFRSGYQD